MEKRSIWGEAALAICATVIVALAARMGLTEALGAHPWWAVKAGVGGALGGLLAFGVLRGVRLPARWLVVLAAIALLASLASAFYGKQIFVGSYAENALAGRFWFFGWIATAGAASALLSALAVWRLRR